MPIRHDPRGPSLPPPPGPAAASERFASAADARIDAVACDDARLLGAARLAFYSPVVQQPSLADRKARFLLTVTGLLATTMFLFVPQTKAIISGPDRALGLILAVLSSALVGLLLGVAKYAYSAYVTSMPSQPELTFFRHIADRDVDQYALELRGASLREAIEAILCYNHAAAIQAVAKYRRVDRAQVYLRLAIPSWMAAMAIIALCG